MYEPRDEDVNPPPEAPAEPTPEPQPGAATEVLPGNEQQESLDTTPET